MRPLPYHMPLIVPILLLLILPFSSCGEKEQNGEGRDLVTFPLKGEVVRIDRERMRLSVAHEEIPNYMDAMTMPFKVKDSMVFERVAVGDSITATLAVSRVESWLEGIQVIGTGDTEYMSPADVMFKRLYPVGEPLPDLSFRDQEDRSFSFAELKGKAVAITFIYTRCPLPDFCILMSNNFSKVQTAMKRSKLPEDTWHLVTVSFDPENDTPEVLKRYGTQYGADFDVWSFVTSDPATINDFATGFDLYVAAGNGGLIDHTLRTVLLDKRGNLVSMIKGNSWTADELAAELEKLARD